MFSADIFLVTQSPAHLVELQHVKLLPYLGIKMQHSVGVKVKLVSTSERSVFTNAKQDTGVCLLSKPRVCRM